MDSDNENSDIDITEVKRLVVGILSDITRALQRVISPLESLIATLDEILDLSAKDQSSSTIPMSPPIDLSDQMDHLRQSGKLSVSAPLLSALLSSVPPAASMALSEMVDGRLQDEPINYGYDQWA